MVPLNLLYIRGGEKLGETHKKNFLGDKLLIKTFI